MSLKPDACASDDPQSEVRNAGSCHPELDRRLRALDDAVRELELEKEREAWHTFAGRKSQRCPAPSS